MKITVIGAGGGEVTGSAYLVQTKTARFLVDCGMFQGGRKSEALNRPPMRTSSKLDAVLLTHGHLDHTGRLPLLTQLGYEGPVYATPATIDMTALILRDSAKLQEMEAERQNRRREPAGQRLKEPLYDMEDVEQIVARMQPIPYARSVPVAEGVQATWMEAGHMLGSASIQLQIDEDSRRKTVLFSGDLGPKGIPILRDFETFPHADLVFIESTYGDRNHRPFAETVNEFVRVVKDAVNSGGKILVPTFAVGRAQLLVGLLGWMFRMKKARPFPIFLDSPMAIQATKIYTKNREIFDDQMKRFIAERPLSEDLVTLKVTLTARDSMRINEHTGPCMILAGAGMCNGGRILHHLKANLFKKETYVLFVGYQGHGSLGRRIIEGQPNLKIHGQPVVVRAQVHTMGGFSAHAGQKDLLTWVSGMAPSRPRVVVTHGENGPRAALAGQIQKQFGLKTFLPGLGEVIEF